MGKKARSQGHTYKDGDALFCTWKRRLEQICHEQVLPLAKTQSRYSQLREAAKGHEKVPRGGSLFEWMLQGHLALVSLAIRRTTDQAGDSVSLIKLLSSMKQKAEFLTRSRFVEMYSMELRGRDFADRDFDRLAGRSNVESFPVDALELDIKRLLNVARNVRIFANKYIAHSASARQKAKVAVTFDQIDFAAKVIETIYQRYHFLLIGYENPYLTCFDENDIRKDLEGVWPPIIPLSALVDYPTLS